MLDGNRVIVVVGEGSERSIPDRCLVTLALNVIAETVADAVTRVGLLADKVADTLRQRGMSGADIQTQTLSVQDFFDQNQQKVTARVATYVLTIKAAIDDIGPHLESVTEVAGDSLQVRALQLMVSQIEPLREVARRRAVEDAQAHAAQLAEAAHVRLGPILSIEEGAGRGGWPGPQRMSAASLASGMASIPIEPGTVSTTVLVTVTFQVEA